MAEPGMGEWAPLPAELGREARALAESCRLLKERTGLSLAALAERTHYSKSSWQRCLNGRQIPPRSALRSLAEVAETDPARLLGLREAVLRHGRSALMPGPPRQPGPSGLPGLPVPPGQWAPYREAAAGGGADTEVREPQDGEGVPAPSAPAVTSAVRRWRLVSAVLLVLLLAVTGTALAVQDQGRAGCTTVETDP